MQTVSKHKVFGQAAGLTALHPGGRGHLAQPASEPIVGDLRHSCSMRLVPRVLTILGLATVAVTAALASQAATAKPSGKGLVPIANSDQTRPDTRRRWDADQRNRRHYRYAVQRGASWPMCHRWMARGGACKQDDCLLPSLPACRLPTLSGARSRTTPVSGDRAHNL